MSVNATNYDVDRRPVTLWSEGSRLAAELLRPVGAFGLRPAILLCHGWGGLKEHLAERYAAPFARAGYVCLVFDYRGWGGSDGRMIPVKNTPMLTEAGERDVRVHVVREVVDPLDQIADIRAALAYLLSEDGVDQGRVGLWGSSYGGGHVVFTAGTDARVKTVVAQIGGYGHPREAWYTDLARRRMADKARAVLNPPIPQGVDTAAGLKGTPDVARQCGHSPLEAAARIRVPTLFIDAENEEYGEPALQGGAAYDIVRRHAKAERHTFPCTHYEVYDKFYEPSLKLAVDWFAEHL
ncbi:alpha/beta fold hydrolase [Bradyrhizobium sp. NAS80.1]|uniref:alpha/beta hydrolase n=1 Tax=Bradyrhizobium sp. NAS80.1 TaxID=1680159 RepID=UPI000A00DAE7|nr:alpha/beta fold hydrolase [Bradyrhizobium sp. NAS80.1]